MALLDAGYTRKELSGQLVWGMGWAIITAFGLFLHADKHGHGTHQQLGLPPCPSVTLSGRPCPGCGLTTSWTALLHGDIVGAFHAHLFGPILYILFAASGILSLYGYAKNMKFDSDTKTIHRCLIGLIIVFMAYGAYRFATTPNYAFDGEGLPKVLQRHF